MWFPLNIDASFQMSRDSSRRNLSTEIRFHWRYRECFSDSILSWDLAKVLLSKIDQILSIELYGSADVVEVGLTALLCHFSFMNQCRVLLKSPFLTSEVFLGTGNYNCLQNITSINFFVHFDPLYYENNLSLAAGANSAANYNGLSILMMLDDNGRSSSDFGPDSVVLKLCAC